MSNTWFLFGCVVTEKLVALKMELKLSETSSAYTLFVYAWTQLRDEQTPKDQELVENDYSILSLTLDC